MTDTNTGNQAVEGEVGSPNQTTSATSPQAISGLDAETLRKALKPLVEEEVARRTQSVKDKRIGKLESRQDDFESQLARFNRLKEELGNEKLAHLYMKVEDQGLAPSDEVSGTSVSQNKATLAGTPTETAKLTQQLTTALGLDANDPEMTKILGENELSLQLSQMLALSDRRKKAQEAPNPASRIVAMSFCEPRSCRLQLSS